MAQKKVDLTLPEWVFLDGSSPFGNTLGLRTIILHVRSMTIIEIFDRDFDGISLNPDVLTYKFKNVHPTHEERLIAAVHHSCMLDVNTDRELIKRNVLIPGAKWYCAYCDWEDNIKPGDIKDDM